MYLTVKETKYPNLGRMQGYCVKLVRDSRPGHCDVLWTKLSHKTMLHVKQLNYLFETDAFDISFP